MLAANPTSCPFTLNFEGAPTSESGPVSGLCVLHVSVFTSPNLSPFSFKLLAPFTLSYEGSGAEGSTANLRYLVPFFAAPVSSLQPMENKTTLSPFAATLTGNVNHNPFVCHSYRKHPGWGATLPSLRVSAYSASLRYPYSFLAFDFQLSTARPERRRRSTVSAQLHSQEATQRPFAKNAKIDSYLGGDSVSTEAVAARRHAGTHLPVTWWKLEMPTTTWHLLLN